MKLHFVLLSSLPRRRNRLEFFRSHPLRISLKLRKIILVGSHRLLPFPPFIERVVFCGGELFHFLV